MMRPTSILFFLVSLVSIKSSHGIYCLVGKGNASEVLPTDITMDQDEIKSMMKDKGVLKYGSFISRECDNSKDSALKNIEEITKNVKKKIEDGINGLQKIGNSLSETLKLDQKKRKKREDGSDTSAEPSAESSSGFACAKVVMGGNAYRSCVPKVEALKLKCVSGTGLSICYCHENNCNDASEKSVSGALLLFTCSSMALLTLKRFTM